MGGVGEEMRVLESREWYSASYAPQGVPNSDHLKIRIAKLSLVLNSIPEQHVILETLFLSVDPYLRSRMTGREDGLYFPQFNLNEVIIAFGVGRVIKSNDTNYSEGDIVISPVTPLAEYCVVIADPKPGSNVFISAAAGGVGMYAGQLAKLKGSRVIGSTGSDEKVRLMKEEFGYDDAFNYHKEIDFDAALSK
ncbi:hypothetical protein ACE6H2_011746 [Prunus campanulata]